MKRFFSVIIGLVLVAVVIFSGIKTYEQNIVFTILFGLASAFVAPLAISILGYSFKKKDITLDKLSKIPEIEKMIQEAETQEEINRKLKEEKENLLKYIKAESHKLAAEERKKALEKDAKRILLELDEVDELMKSFSDSDNETDKDIVQLRKRIKEITNRRHNTIRFIGEDIELDSLIDIYYLPSRWLMKKNRKITSNLRNMLNKKQG